MRRTTVVAALSGLLVASTLAAAPALAAKPPARTTIAANLSPATALVKSSAVVSGTVHPTGGSVVLQRLVGTTWQSVASRKPSSAGAFTFSVRAPKAAATWRLRVTRTSSKSAKAGVSNPLTLHVVPTGYLVAAAAAPVTAPEPVVVTGSVAPQATGPVQLQRLSGATWTTIATSKLTASGFSVTTALPAGSVRLRVVKPFSTKLAAGTSPTFEITVRPATPAAHAPSIVTTALPPARVGQLFVTALTAAGGTGAYSWSATGLPTGLSLSAAGILAGTPVAKGSSSIAASVTDAAGRTSTVTLALAVAAPAGRLFSVGNDANGRLGNGSNTSVSTLVPVVGQSAVTSVASEGSSAVAADADGTVWAWGDNTRGSLGTGDTTASLVPVRTVGLTNITAVAGMDGTGLALRADGTVWAWGANGFGEVGDGTTIPVRLTPVQVTGLTSVVAIAGGLATGYALRSDGTVWAWGYNYHGQLGDGTGTDRATPAQVTGLSQITAIAAGSESGYALRSDGSVFSWGNNDLGQLGDGTNVLRVTPVQITTLAGVTAIAGAYENAYALSASGSVLAWGNGSAGGLGTGTASNASSPVAVHNLTGVTAISSSGIDAVARLADGSLSGWGRNLYGELGDSSTTQRSEPVAMIGATGVIGLGSGATGYATYVIAG